MLKQRLYVYRCYSKVFIIGFEHVFTHTEQTTSSLWTWYNYMPINDTYCVINIYFKILGKLYKSLFFPASNLLLHVLEPNQL